MKYKIDLSKEDPKNIFIAVSDPYYSANGDEAAICIIKRTNDGTQVLHTAVARYESRPDYYKELMEISKFYECHTIIKEGEELEIPNKNYKLQHKIDNDKYIGLANRIGKEEGEKIVDGYLKTNRDRIPFPSLLDEWLNLKAPDRFSISVAPGLNTMQIVFNNNYFRTGDSITSNTKDYYTVIGIEMIGMEYKKGYLYTFNTDIPQDKDIKYIREGYKVEEKQ